MIKAHWAYLKGLVGHKLGVLYGCLIVDVPIVTGIIHDWTKFLPCEWFAYVKQFRNPDGTKRECRNPDGSYDPSEQPVGFQKAWMHHQRNKHHWQAWSCVGDGGNISPIEMPEKYVREMIADWIGASRTYEGKWPELHNWKWYNENFDKIRVHPKTKNLIISLLVDRI